MWWGLAVLPGAAMAAGVDATIGFARRVELAFPVSGVIEKVEVAAGQRVAKGQPLARLEDTPFRAALEQAEAEVTVRRADRDEATRDHKQAKELYDRSVLSTVELENANNRAQRAGAALKDAHARLAQARYALDRSRLVAPFDAWVLEVRAVPGAAVVSALEARTQVVLAAHGEYLARSRAPAPAVARLAPGAAVSVQAGGRTYAGKVVSVGLEPLDGKSGEGALHELVVLFQSAEALRPGLPVKIELP
jgi:RND family efflux transporter MFP subunit